MSDETSLSVSIVIYDSTQAVLDKTFDSLLISLIQSQTDGLLDHCSITLVDNGDNVINTERLEPLEIQVLQNKKNIGFGAAHNQAISASSSQFHLVLNPDVELEPSTISAFLMLAKSNSDMTLICPRGRSPSGADAYLAKRYPALMDLLLRGFMPGFVKSRFSDRLAHYEYQELDAREPADVELVSGCCMFLRTQAAKAQGAFDESFFLYFEDFDLSITMRSIGRVVYAPDINIVHHGGNSARKGARHILMFVRSAIRFFNKHGWKLT